MPSRPSRLLAGTVLGLLLTLVASGCGGDEKPRSSPTKAAPTPIERVNGDALRVARVAFCKVVPEAAVRDALAGKPEDASAWSNGERAPVDGSRHDVVHEYGCSWQGGGSTASAWVFARPVSPDLARAVLAKTAKRSGCENRPGPGFGSPGRRQVCTQADGERRVRLSGLFQDTWLTCQVSAPATVPAASLTRRTDAWCVQVANATNTAD